MRTLIRLLESLMSTTKPWVQVACVCENVLFDKENTASLIRIVDSFTAHIPKDLPKGIPAGFQLNLFVRLAFPDTIVAGRVAVQARNPDGTKGPKTLTPFEASPRRNLQLKIEFHILSPQAGGYWFDVFWDDEVITSVPINVKLAQYGAIPDATVRLANPKTNEKEQS